MDIAKLGFEVKTDQLVKGREELGRLSSGASKAESSTDKFSRSQRDSEPASLKMAKGVGVAQKALLGFVSAATVGAFLSIAGEVDDLKASLELVEGSSQGAEDSFKSLTRIANNLRAPISQVTDLYRENSTELREMGYSSQQSMNYVQGLTAALDASSIKGQRAESVMAALSKSMALGKLSGENLNTVIAAGGLVSESLAQELGVTTLELRKLGMEGKITGDVIVNSMINNMDDLTDAANLGALTFADSMVLFKNSLMLAVAGFDDASGASSVFAQGLKTISEALDGVDWDTVAKGAQLLIILIGSKLAASILLAAKAQVALTASSLAGTVQMNAMGQVVSRTTVQMNAMALAATGARNAMALLGGPVGIAIAAASALYLYATSTDKASTGSAELDARINKLNSSFDGMTQKAAAAAIVDYTQKIENLKQEAIDSGKEMLKWHKYINDAPNGRWADEYRANIARARAEQEILNNTLIDAQEKIRQLQAIADGKPLQGLTDGGRSASEVFESLRRSILEQTLALQHNTAEALFNARVKAGLVGELAEGEQVVLAAMYKNYDAEKKLSDARRIGHKDAERTIKAYDEKAKAIEDAIRALQNEAATLGMSSEQIRLNELVLLGASDAQIKLAESASNTIRVYHEQIAAMERMSSINMEAVSIIGSLMTEEEAIADSYKKRRDIILEATDITEQQRTQAMIRLEEERAEVLSRIDEDYWNSKYMSEFEREALELEKFDRDIELLNESYALKLELLEEQRSSEYGINAQWNEQEAALKQEHEDRIANIERARRDMQLIATSKMFGDMSTATKAFFGENSKVHQAALVAEKAFAIARVLINAPASYSGAYAAMVGIPVVGPVLAPIAGAAAVAAQLAQASAIGSVNVSGMAHDGIDSVPQTGTWLLEKGERVTTSETSAKLDATLDQIRSQGGGGANVTVNLYEDAEKAGSVEQQDNDDGSTDINVFVSDIMGGGERAQALQAAFGLQRQGS